MGTAASRVTLDHQESLALREQFALPDGVIDLIVAPRGLPPVGRPRVRCTDALR
jgi:hypothetical protein